MAESSGNPKAIDSHDPYGGSYGLWQINGSHAPGGYATPSWEQQMFDPVNNANEGYQVFKHAPYGGYNFIPWGTYTNGSYKQYLPAATAAAETVMIDPSYRVGGSRYPNVLPTSTAGTGGNGTFNIGSAAGTNSYPCSSTPVSISQAATSGGAYDCWASQGSVLNILGSHNLDNGNQKALVSGLLLVVGMFTMVTGLGVLLLSGVAGSPGRRVGSVIAAAPVVAGKATKKVAGKATKKVAGKATKKVAGKATKKVAGKATKKVAGKK
jgi:hypothetical protein